MERKRATTIRIETGRGLEATFRTRYRASTANVTPQDEALAWRIDAVHRNQVMCLPATRPFSEETADKVAEIGCRRNISRYELQGLREATSLVDTE